MSDNTQATSGTVNTEAPKNDTVKGKKIVEVDEETLKGIADIVRSLKSEVEALKKESEEKEKKNAEEIKMLKEVADKGRMFKYEVDNAKGGQIIREAKIGMWEDEPIVAWQMISDDVGFREGRMVVNQRVRIFAMPEGSDKPKPIDLDYLVWAQNTRTQIGQVISTSNDSTGNYWTVEMKDGRKLTLDIKFINPF